MSVEDLLYALMLNSANEAANVLAEHIAGSIDDFSIMMNEKAKELGCENTHFLNANGMHNDNHYTTAKDLAIITQYAMKNNTFKKIVSTLEYTLPSTEQYPNTNRIMKNTNLLIHPENSYYYPYATGIKTGYTKQAGNCLVSSAKNENIELICVTLNAESTHNSSSYRFQDNKSLLEYGYKNFSNQKIVEKNTVVDNIEIQNATKETKDIQILIKDDIYDYVPNDINVEKTKVEINKNLEAPIYVGDTIGSIIYTANGKKYSSDLVAGSTAYTAHNYGAFILFVGLVILIFSIIILFKKKH